MYSLAFDSAHQALYRGSPTVAAPPSQPGPWRTMGTALLVPADGPLQMIFGNTGKGTPVDGGSEEGLAGKPTLSNDKMSCCELVSFEWSSLQG